MISNKHFFIADDLIYSLTNHKRPDGTTAYRDGKPIQANDITIVVKKSKDSTISPVGLTKFIDYMTKCANEYQFNNEE